MIDIESELFTLIAETVRGAYPDAFVSQEYVARPARFPAVSIRESSNTANRSTQTSSQTENHADVMYEVNVYSNRAEGKKAECKAIIALIDEQFGFYGFTRSFLNAIPNLNEATVYRMTARYTATVSADKTIYRR